MTALVVATFLLLTTQILRVGEAAFGYGLSLPDFLLILGLLIPRFLVFALPLAVLVGVLAGLGRLAADREILALSAAGLSPSRLCPAPLLVGFLASIVCLGLTAWGEPKALSGLTQRLATVVERNLAAGLEPGVIHQDIPGVLLHARERLEDGRLKDVFLQMELEAGKATIASRFARLDPTGGVGIHLSLKDGEMLRASAAEKIQTAPEQDLVNAQEESTGPRLDRVQFESAEVGLDVAEAADRRARFIGGLDALTITELRSEMYEAPAEWTRGRATVAFHRRLAVPFSCLSLSILGMGMAMAGATPGTKRRGSGFVGGIGAMLGYYMLLRVAENMALTGKAAPSLLLWIPNLMAALIGVCLLILAVRR